MTTSHRVPRRRYKVSGLRLGDGLDPVRPTLRTVPAECPRCGNTCLRHYGGTPEVNCFCGWEAILEQPMACDGQAWRWR